MIQVRKSLDRGHAQHGWLESYHTFSFANYHDPNHMGFRSLRVINEDRVQPGKGFDTHSHRDMEIISYVISGALEHKDSMGNGSIIRPGDVQRMSAGTGVVHSEYNQSKTDTVHFLQIWITPDEEGIQPGYEQKFFPDEEKRGKLCLVASPDGRDGSIRIHQNALIFSTLADGDESVEHELADGRQAYVHVARGNATVNGEVLKSGDALKIRDERNVTIQQGEQAEILLFDLP